MIEKMWELLTTFTEEAQQAALSKCKELSLDQNRGVVSLDESYVNLSSACNILKDAIETEKLIQLPITIQKRCVEETGRGVLYSLDAGLLMCDPFDAIGKMRYPSAVY